MKNWQLYGGAIGVGVLSIGLIIGSLALTAPATPVEIEPPHQLVLADPELLYKLPAYDTLEEAGVHAIERAYKCSHVYECGGPIARRPDGKFVVGPVGSGYAGDHTEVSHEVPEPFQLAADYHSHPCLPDSHEVALFSPPDLTGAIAEKLPAFMGDLCTGEVHLFDPSKDSPNDTPAPHNIGLYVTAGRIVGKIPVDGAIVEPKTGML